MRVETYAGPAALDDPGVREVLARVAADRGLRRDVANATRALVTTGAPLSASFSARDHLGACGYGQLEQRRDGWTFEYVVSPDHADHADVGGQLVAAARAHIAAQGGGPWTLWLSAPSETDEAVAAAAGLAFNRELFQLRVALPRADPVTIRTRPFVVGRDEAEWLGVNNRAFAWHPDQSNWTIDDLRRRFAEPWFDADGFLVHEVGDQMVGFCWTKRHDEYDQPLGEIYVIAKDVDAGERGLGRQLTLAGLAYLAGLGLGEAMLYVDASNARALDLYFGMGFRTHHADRNYVDADTPTSAPTP